MASIQEIATTLRGAVKPGMSPKDIRVAVREKHPDVSKKEIVRAAFYALTDTIGPEDGAADLHGFAISERGFDEEPEGAIKAGKLRTKKMRSRTAAEQAGS